MAENNQYLYTIKPTRLEMLTEGPTAEEQAIVAEHFKHLQRLAKEGLVVLAGRTQDANEDSFGIVILYASTEEEARQRMEADPAVKHGVMQSALYPYRVAAMAEYAIGADLIAHYFGMNQRVIHMQTEGLTHEESLLTPPFRGNSLNWVIGHMIAGRSSALRLLGGTPVWSEQEAAPYVRDSEPIAAEKAYRLEKLIADLDESQERLESALQDLTAQELGQVNGDRTLGERLAFAYWHEAYHAGQTELLRQLAGMDDKII